MIDKRTPSSIRRTADPGVAGMIRAKRNVNWIYWNSSIDIQGAALDANNTINRPRSSTEQDETKIHLDILGLLDRYKKCDRRHEKQQIDTGVFDTIRTKTNANWRYWNSSIRAKSAVFETNNNSRSRSSMS